MKKKDFKEIKKLINVYFEREFGEDCTINSSTLTDNIKNFGLAYTTSEEEEPKEIQVSTNIITKTIFTYYDNKLVDKYSYSTLEEYKEFLTHLDFDELIYF